MKTLILSGSARKQGNTSLVLNKLTVPHTRIELSEKHISHYIYNNTTKDDFHELSDFLLQAELIIFSTPVYWYAMSGYMKVFFDRMTELVKLEKEKGRKLQGKSVFLISTSATPETPYGFEYPFSETSKYLGMNYLGSKHFYFPKDLELSNRCLSDIKHLNAYLNQEIGV